MTNGSFEAKGIENFPPFNSMALTDLLNLLLVLLTFFLKLALICFLNFFNTHQSPWSCGNWKKYQFRMKQYTENRF